MSESDFAVLLLAAGRGSRFGGGKLAAPLAGKPLSRHASDRLATLPARRHLAICSAQTPELPGFDRLILTPPDAPLATSIATGISALGPASAVLIALADMPLVPTRHFQALLAAFDGDRIASRVDGRLMVPAVFGCHHFGALLELEGDRGAGALLHDAQGVDLQASLAVDIDTAADLQRVAGAVRCV